MVKMTQTYDQWLKTMENQHITINGIDTPNNMELVHIALKQTTYNKWNNTIHHVGNICICMYWHTHEYVTTIHVKTQKHDGQYQYVFDHTIHNMGMDGPTMVANYDTWSQQTPLNQHNVSFMAMFGEIIEHITMLFTPIIPPTL